MTNLKNIFKLACPTMSSEWNNKVESIAWERDDEGNGEHAEIRFDATLSTLIKNGETLESFKAYELMDIGAEGLLDAVVEMLEIDGLDVRDHANSPTVAIQIPDDGFFVTFAANETRFTVACKVTGTARRESVAA